MWKSVVSQYRDGLDVLPGPGATGIREVPTAERIRHVLRFAGALYSWVVIDLGRLTASSLSILEETKALYVVTTPELPALYEASRVLRRLLEAGFARDRLNLLLNRRVKKSSITAEDIEGALGYPIYGQTPDTPEEIADYYGERRFLDENLQVHKQVAQIVRKSRGVDDKASTAGRGLFKRLRAGA
jgi:Flp pilus assembly CpaE family ATPase